LSDAVSLRPVLFGGFRKTRGFHRCKQRQSASPGVHLPFRVFRLRSARTRIGLGAPLMPFATRAGLQGHHALRHRSRLGLQLSSLGLPRSFRVRPRVERPPSCPKPVRTAAPPLRFLPLQRIPVEGSGLSCPGVPRPRRHASPGFLNLLTPSSASDLPALFQTGSAPGVLPSEPSSSRAAARRLRRQCPPVVRNRRVNATVGVVAGAKDSAPIPSAAHVNPELPAFRALLRARVRHQHERFRLAPARSSLGIHPLQGSLPHRDGSAFTAPPLLWLPTPCTGQLADPLQGLTRRRDWLVSRRRLPTLMGFWTF
jgi:hypothetical protein